MVYVKSLHVIFMVSWFSALFYMPRLLIYHVEAQDKEQQERDILSAQFKIMQKRLWYAISWPAMILTWIFGLWITWYRPDLYGQAWFILKLCFAIGLTLYHLKTHQLFQQHQRDVLKWTSFRLRLWNEVATIFLFVIVFLVIPKSNDTWVWITLSAIVLGIALFAAVSIYRKNRAQEEQKQRQHPDINS
jgi:putative membrane protein